MLKLKHKIPQVGYQQFTFQITDGNIICDFENVIVDFVVSAIGELLLGHGHYKMSGKSDEILFAGRLMITNKKIVYIDDDSGHYEPSYSDMTECVDFFNNKDLLSSEFSMKFVKRFNFNIR